MQFDLTQILPHKAPMILIDDIKEINIDAKYLIATFSVYPQKLFYEKDKGINSLVGIEFMAQAIAAYSHFSHPHKEPSPGLLLGTRLYNNSVAYFLPDYTYDVRVAEIFNDTEIVVFDCLIYDNNGNEIASATINAYQGENIGDILQSE